MDTSIKRNYYSEQKTELLQWFETVKQDLYHQLVVRYSKENISQILFQAEEEFDEMIPDLPYVGGNDNPYTRLVILSGMSVAFYLALFAVLKSKTLARGITYILFKNYMGKTSKNWDKVYSGWMFFRILRQRLK